MKVYPVVLTGGAGTRLWPLSREYYPKPLLSFLGGRTLLQESAVRLDGLEESADPVVVCNDAHRFLVAEQIQSVGKQPGAIILEPEGRNTAPALTLAALHAIEADPDAVMVAMPADHVIPDRERFTEIVARGVQLAGAGFLVTFGVVPARPETGYGYIRRGEAIGNGDAWQVARFVEKPDQSTAEQYLASGDYFWNSGIFAMRADRWLEELERFRPDIVAACRQAWAGGSRDLDFTRIDGNAFRACPGDSIDYAVMEKTDRAAVVPLDTPWSDVGAWPALWELGERDEAGNVVQGDVLMHDTRNSMVLAQNRCVATVGIDNLVVVETTDAVLVAHRDRAQDVKAIVTQLRDNGREEHLVHSRVYRPWGDYEGIDMGERYQVKRLTVKPGAALSLQMHHHRAEHWIVVKGTARVTRGDEVFMLSENESTYIPLGVKHRLENPGTIPLEIIEVQSGSYLGEDDIVRFEDIYDRVE